MIRLLVYCVVNQLCYIASVTVNLSEGNIDAVIELLKPALDLFGLQLGVDNNKLKIISGNSHTFCTQGFAALKQQIHQCH